MQKKAINNSSCISECLRELGFITVSGGGPYKQFKNLCSHYGLGIVFTKTKVWGNKKGPKTKVPLEAYLSNHKYITSNKLKKKLYDEGLKEPKCEKCGIVNWEEKPLTLHLDHVNGDSSDNRLDNLQILCPNCHSQTTTYAGRNSNSYYRKKDKTPKVDRVYSSKIEWPCKEDLQVMVNSMPVTDIAKLLKVSDVAVHKKCCILGIQKKHRGYWLSKS